MATLTEGQKSFIVQALACYDSPQTVADAVKEEFDVEVGRQQVAQYDPTKHAGAKLAKKWRVMFHACRENFKTETGKIAISQRSFRLRTMERLAAKAEKMRNIPLAIQILEQAAKEVGDMYVNRRLDAPKVPGSDNPLPDAEYVLSPDEDAPDHPIL